MANIGRLPQPTGSSGGSLAFIPKRQKSARLRSPVGADAGGFAGPMVDIVVYYRLDL